jgi:spermidine synthase
MVISLALLGYGASGTFLTLIQDRLDRKFAFFFLANVTAFGVASLLCGLLAQRVPFNPEELLWDVRQLIRLPLVYLLLGLPFFFVANAIGLALSRFPEHTPRIYAADLTGAGAGSLLILGLLYVVYPSTALRIISTAGFVAGVIAWRELSLKPDFRLAGILAAGVLALILPGAWIEPAVSPYKGLPQLMMIPGTRILEQRSSPLGLLTVVESTQVPLRNAPGLSLNAMSGPPSQLAIFTDSDSMTAITHFTGNLRELEYLDQMTSALPYHLQPLHNALILCAGGGSEVLQARYHRAEHIDAVELNPQIVDLVQTTYAPFAGSIYNHPGTHIHPGDARGFVRTQRQEYDLIQLAVPGGFGASSAGLYALNESYLFTVEAFEDYIKHLAPNGFLDVTTWVKMPPRDTIKAFATAVEALKHSGVARPDQRLILIRSWQTSTLLVKNGLISPEETLRLKRFCEARSFDLSYYPGMKREEESRFNFLPRTALLYDAAVALLGVRPETFERAYKFNVKPATDDRPYFFHYFRWRILPDILKRYAQGSVSLLETGYLVLIVALVQAILIGFILIVLPLWVLGRRKDRNVRRESPGGPDPAVARSRVLAYFFALGLAFLFIEIAFIQKLMLLLLHPVFSISVSLSSFLVFAGLGSAWSGRLQTRFGGLRTIRMAVAAIVILGIASTAALGKMIEALSASPDLARILIAIAFIAPLGFFMGMPFPQGIRMLRGRAQNLIPWAWGINGCASVLSSILATVLAIDLGFTGLLLLALLLYGTAAMVFPDLEQTGNDSA